MDKGPEQSADRFQQPPAPAKDAVDEAAFDHVFQLQAGGKAHKEQEQQQLAQNAGHQQTQQIGKGKAASYFKAKGNRAADSNHHHRHKQIKGDAVDKIGGNGIAAVPVSGGAHQKDEQQDGQNQRGNGNGNQFIAQPIGRFIAVQRKADIVRSHPVFQNIALHGADYRRFLLCFLLCSRFFFFTARFRRGRCCGNRRHFRPGGVFRQSVAQV